MVPIAGNAEAEVPLGSFVEGDELDEGASVGSSKPALSSIREPFVADQSEDQILMANSLEIVRDAVESILWLDRHA